LSGRKREKETRLSELSPGDNATVVSVEKLSPLWGHRLSSMGIYPGARVQLKRKFPEFLLRVGYTQIAINYRVASRITVCRLTL